MVPDVGLLIPTRIRIAVVLPAPLGPMNPYTLPRGICKLRRSSATSEPNFLRVCSKATLWVELLSVNVGVSVVGWNMIFEIELC